MMSKKKKKYELEDTRVSLKTKVAALWASLMFLYLYVDYFHLYMPGKIDNILNGFVFKFDITQAFRLTALASMTIPAIMIFLSVALPARTNRLLNITIATIYIPYTLFNLAGEIPWLHMVFAAVAEVALLCIIIAYAWKWPVLQNQQPATIVT